jgi:hypothetical protein
MMIERGGDIEENNCGGQPSSMKRTMMNENCYPDD